MLDLIVDVVRADVFCAMGGCAVVVDLRVRVADGSESVDAVDLRAADAVGI